MSSVRFVISAVLVFIFTFLEVNAQEERNLLSTKYASAAISDLLIVNDDWVSHPHYKDREGWQKIPENIRKQYVEEGEKYVDFTWPNVQATEYLEYVRSGNREVMQNPFNEKKRALHSLVMAELMEGKGRFIDDIVNGVWDFCEMTYWGLSAHISLQKAGSGLPDVTEPTIDLGAGEVAADLAWTHYFLKDEFDKINPLISKRIEYEIDRKILQPYYTRNDFWWMGFANRSVNNWNPWCNYNVLTCILLMEDDAGKKRENTYKVMRSVDQFINYYKDDGGCDEGPSYWNHAGGKLFDVLELLHKASDGKITIYDEEVVKNIGRYIYRAYINDRYFINFADASNRVTARAGVIYRYGKRIDDPVLEGFGVFLARQQNFGESPSRDRIELALENLFALDAIAKAEAVEPLIKSFWLSGTEVAGAREDEGSTKGFYFAAKGGHNSESHNHNDVGSFILYYDGEPALIDAGVGTYTRKTFSGQRYDIWTMRSLYHNLPMINNTEQKAGKQFAAKSASFEDKGKVVRFSTDISAAYPETAQVNRWIRSYTLERKKRFVIGDEFDLKAISGPTQLNFLSAGKIEKVSDGEAKIIGKGFTLRMTWDRGQYDFAVEEVDMEDDQRLTNAWPDGLRRIQLTRKDNKLKGSTKVMVEAVRK